MKLNALMIFGIANALYVLEELVNIFEHELVFVIIKALKNSFRLLFDS